MGAIGGFLGLNGGAAGTGFGGPTAQPMDPQGMQNLQNSYQQLQQVASGNGPNPAMAQYNQNVQNLAKQQSGAISSIQGISPALAARMISQQGSGAMQNAAAEGANMQAQQQLGAMGQMGNIAGQQAGIAAGMQQNVNNANAGLAGGVMGMQSTAIGGLMNAGGKGMAMAGGGEVQNFAGGGGIGPQSQFAQFLSQRASQPSPVNVESFNFPSTVAKSGGGGGKSSSGAAENQGQGPTQANAASMGAGIPYAQPMNPGFSRGGKVPAMVSPGEVYIPPGKIGKALRGNPLAAGEKIPGKPKVAGNSYANDTVAKTLQSGGVVIPNSIMQSANPAQGAHDMISNIIAKRKAGK